MTERPRERRVQLNTSPQKPRVGGKRTPSMLAGNADLSQITPEEWETLLHGEKYSCQLLVGTTDTRDVILNVSLSGIRLLDPRNEEMISHFDIEQILQYSYSQQNSTFSFSYLEDGRFFVTHKFLTSDFFEIHQYLGNAISIVIKLKTQIKKTGASEVLSQIDTARHDKALKSPDKLRREGSVRSQKSDSSEYDDAEPSDGGRRFGNLSAPPKLSPSGSTDSVDPDKKEDSDISEGTISKSSQAKSYFEDRYKGGDKLKDGRRTFRLSIEDSRKLSEYADEGGRPASSPEIRDPKDKELEERKKLANKTISGSMRLKGFSEVVAQFDFKTLKKKRPNVSELSDRMKNSNTFLEINPAELPETVTKMDEGGTPVLIKTMQNGKYQITAGTADALVEALADHSQPDSLYIDVFLQTYRNFMTPEILMEKLKGRFSSRHMRVAKEEEISSLSKEKISAAPQFTDLDQETLQLVRLRIASVIKKWVERHWYDFDSQDMSSTLLEFLALMREQKLEGIAIQINNAINRHKEEEEKRLAKGPRTLENKPMKEVDLNEVPPKDIAQNLTLVSVDLLKAIAPDEFVFYIWGKKSNPLTAKMTENLQRLIDRFNKIGFWVATEICACQDPKKRIAMMEKFISVAKYLLKFQNYNDLIAVLSGLQTIPVYRLKKTWQGLSPKMHGLFKELEAKMGPEGNYKLYRQIEFDAKPPYIPFFGLYMKDLTFMNDGNQTYLPNGMINLEKHRTIMGAVLSIRSSQQSLYSFEHNAALRKYCEVIYNKDEDELIQESNVLEPSNRQRRASLASVGSEFSVSTDQGEDSPHPDAFDG